MNKKSVRRLQLTSETLRQLDGANLKIAGGVVLSGEDCPPTFTRCSNLCPARDTDQCGNSVTCTYTIDLYSRYNYGCL